ncbi:unnamed protein product [Musa acuminata subsp. malaccensis]|uniref:(wild Malaysian banana) hypothetical protein n=1 Tax=Musa acuminata subsp. malaccensis TaxID=214687 RepID=A0A804IUL8_MUSAM|nr:unnamed protein product [Musa acuminata subsp. malaccensis]
MSHQNELLRERKKNRKWLNAKSKSDEGTSCGEHYLARRTQTSPLQVSRLLLNSSGTVMNIRNNLVTWP